MPDQVTGPVYTTVRRGKEVVVIADLTNQKIPKPAPACKHDRTNEDGICIANRPICLSE